MTERDLEYLILFGDWKSIFGIVEQRHKVGMLNGIRFIIHSNEQGHNRAHLHAKYQDQEVVISIPDGDIISGNIPIKKQREAARWVKEHSALLTEKWNELVQDGIRIPAL